MSLIVSNTSLNYGNTSTITVSDLTNVSISPSDSVINTETNSGNNIITFTVKPSISTLYYISGYNALYTLINLNTTVYVKVTLLENVVEIPYNTSQQLNVYGAVSYKWSPSQYLSSNTSSSVICVPLENIEYTILGTDSFNTVTKTYLKIIVNTGLIFTPTNPTVYDGNLLNLSVEYTIPSSNLNYVWKSKLFNTLPPNCVHYKYSNTIILHPYNNEEYNVTVYENESILTSGNIKINVIEKPMNIIDIDILPYILYESIINRDKKRLIRLLNENKQLTTKIINFYYTTLQTAYRMEWTNKTGISFVVKWLTLYQIANESNEMILNFNQQWRFFQYINYHQTRNNITTSNFAYLLNTINQTYLEFPQKIGVYPL